MFCVFSAIKANRVGGYLVMLGYWLGLSTYCLWPVQALYTSFVVISSHVHVMSMFWGVIVLTKFLRRAILYEYIHSYIGESHLGANHTPVQISKDFHKQLVIFCNEHFDTVGTRLSLNKLLQQSYNFYIFNRRFLDVTDYDRTPDNVHSMSGQIETLQDELEKIALERDYYKGWRGGIKQRLALGKPINAQFLRELDVGLQDILKKG